jgi:hypothetical protein
MSKEIKIFVDQKQGISNTVIISPDNAQKLGIKNGDQVEVFNPDNNQTVNATAEVSDNVLDFAGKFSKDILTSVNYSGVELVVRSLGQASPQTTQAHQPSQDQIQTPSQSQAPQPVPTPPERSGTFTPPPKMNRPIASEAPKPRPNSTPAPSQTPPPPSSAPRSAQSAPTPPKSPSQGAPSAPNSYPSQSSMGQEPKMQEVEPEPYPNQIDPNILAEQKNGIIVQPVVSPKIEGGRIQLSPNNLQKLGLGQGMLIAWEDPLTRSNGSARIDQAQINDNQIRISQDTKEDTNIQSDQIVLFSTEPPIQKTESLILEVDSRAGLEGYCLVSPRTQHSLSLQKDDVIAFEDELTGAMGAGKVDISETISDNVVVIDSEILEASGIGSFEVEVSKNRRQIIPLQSVSLGISPISGENMWEIVSTARQNIGQLKEWLSKYIIFKGIKLRWKAVNIACSILSCVPDLTGDVLAEITPNSALTLSPQGLIPFNAILILDISRSMMARDVLVTNIAPAIEGIKAAMESREIQEFLKKFKEGVNIPRRISAAFAAVLFLSEKVGRGFGEKVSVIRFADESQILPFGGSFYMDSASGKKGVLEDAARMIVDRIGNAYGQATNMGSAMIKAKTVLDEFNQMNPDQPTMIVLLTDGVPTDGDAFFNAIQQFAENPNVVIYIVGLGNPDDDLMNRAAQLCGGEYFKPDDAGELLVWYSKRARDLSVKLKASKH